MPSRSLFGRVPAKDIAKLSERLFADVILCKVARWTLTNAGRKAVEAISVLKARGRASLLMGRGGIEPYGQEVIARARALGLNVKEATTEAKIVNDHISPLAEATTCRHGTGGPISRIPQNRKIPPGDSRS
jgi:hypothetical protein